MIATTTSLAGNRHLVKVSPGSVSLMMPDGHHYLFDGEGRLWSSWEHGRFCRRGMDGRILRTAPRDRRGEG